MNSFLILLVEDHPNERLAIVSKDKRQPETNLLMAVSTSEAREIIAENPDITAIIMDANVKDGTTFELVRELRTNGFDKPIIAASNSYRDTNELMAAGCDFKSDKRDSWKVTLRAIGINF